MKVADTPRVIGTVVSLLDKVDGVEAKKVLIQLISTLGMNDENKVTIGRADGFRKMLKLLVNGDAELTKQILKTLRHFLEATDTPASGLLSPRSLRDGSGSANLNGNVNSNGNTIGNAASN